ncbi:MAG: hypothetical protein L0229_16205 [Blastocatellia bacterium]|nr:hypothetical protein [Blastocatellia bacterium]
MSTKQITTGKKVSERGWLSKLRDIVEPEQISTNKKVLEGRVAQILNAREIAINIGAKNGVEPGMVFAVLAETPLEVRDPETQELLDVVNREKVRLKATEVREKITICGTYRIKGLCELPVTSLDFLNENLSEERYVKINDRVVLVDE